MTIIQLWEVESDDIKTHSDIDIKVFHMIYTDKDGKEHLIDINTMKEYFSFKLFGMNE